MKNGLILLFLLSMPSFAASPGSRLSGKLTLEEFQIIQERTNRDIYRRLGRINTKTVELAVSTGIIAAATMDKKLWARDIRTEQRYTLIDDDVQGQLFENSLEKLSRGINGETDVYRTSVLPHIKDQTQSVYKDASGDTVIEFDAVDGQGLMKGTLTHYSTTSVFTTGTTEMIKVDGTISPIMRARKGEITREIFDEFKSTAAWTESGTGLWGWTLEKERFVLSAPNYAGAASDYIMLISSNNPVDLSSGIVTVATTLTTEYFDGQHSGDAIKFGLRESGNWALEKPVLEIYFGMAPGPAIYLRYKSAPTFATYVIYEGGYGWWNGGTFKITLQHFGNVTSWNIVADWDETAEAPTIIEGSCITGYYSTAIPEIKCHSGASTGAGLTKIFSWDYYRDVIISTGSSSVAPYIPSIIRPVVDFESAKRGLEIEVNTKGRFLFSEVGGLSVYEDGVYNFMNDRGASAGKIGIYAHEPGIEFYAGGSTIPATVIYSTGQVQISTTTNIKGDVYAYNAIIRDTVTVPAVDFGSATVTSDAFGLRVSSNLYVVGIVTATAYHGSGEHLTDLPQVSSSSYADNAGLLAGRPYDAFVSTAGGSMSGNLAMLGNNYFTGKFIVHELWGVGGINIYDYVDLRDNKIINIDWANSDDGSGSELDADKLDGYDSSDFMGASSFDSILISDSGAVLVSDNGNILVAN